MHRLGLACGMFLAVAGTGPVRADPLAPQRATGGATSPAEALPEAMQPEAARLTTTGPADPKSPAADAPQIEIGGFVELNLLFFPDGRASEPADVLTPAAFAAAASPMRRDRIQASARDTRLHLAARTGSPLGSFALYTEYDLFGPAGAYDPRLRHAYADWTSNNGRWSVRLGQDWSLFADPHSYAAVYNPLPLGAVFVRQPQLRLGYRIAAGLTLAASLESARGDVTAGGGSLASAPFAAPLDIVGAARLERRWGALQLGGLLRNRSASASAPGTGWGVSLSGTVHLRDGPRRSALRFQATYGAGIARYIGELGLGFDRYFSDGARAASGNLRMERVFAGNLSLERYFAPWISASVQGSYVHAGPGSEQSGGRSETAAAMVGNLVLHPTGKLDIAVEYMRARRQDEGAATRHRSLVRLAGRLRF